MGGNNRKGRLQGKKDGKDGKGGKGGRGGGRGGRGRGRSSDRGRGRGRGGHRGGGRGGGRTREGEKTEAPRESVTMSRAAQAMVTEILNKMSSSDPLEIRETVQGVAPLDQDVVEDRVVAELSRKGFKQEDARRAWKRTHDAAVAAGEHLLSFNEQRRQRVARALDLLIVETAEENLPEAFRAAKPKPAPRASTTPENEPLDPDYLAALTLGQAGKGSVSYVEAALTAAGLSQPAGGWPAGGAHAALVAAVWATRGGREASRAAGVARALELVGRAEGWPAPGPKCEARAATLAATMREEELAALRAMFGSDADFATAPDGSWVRVGCDAPDVFATSGPGARTVRVNLTVWFAPGSLYPFEPPTSASFRVLRGGAWVVEPALPLWALAAAHAALEADFANLCRPGMPFVAEVVARLPDSLQESAARAWGRLAEVCQGDEGGEDEEGSWDDEEGEDDEDWDEEEGDEDEEWEEDEGEGEEEGDEGDGKARATVVPVAVGSNGASKKEGSKSPVVAVAVGAGAGARPQSGKGALREGQKGLGPVAVVALDPRAAPSECRGAAAVPVARGTSGRKPRGGDASTAASGAGGELGGAGVAVVAVGGGKQAAGAVHSAAVVEHGRGAGPEVAAVTVEKGKRGAAPGSGVGVVAAIRGGPSADAASGDWRPGSSGVATVAVPARGGGGAKAGGLGEGAGPSGGGRGRGAQVAVVQVGGRGGAPAKGRVGGEEDEEAQLEKMDREEEQLRSLYERGSADRAEASGRDHESRWRDWVRHKSKDASVRLQQSLRRWREAPGGKERQMREQRQRLPAWGFRNEVVRAIESHQVVIVAGETGCGKTTQVPQFILESFIDAGRGGLASIVCTQPRRISATSVAQRVADERCESLGSTVGYHIRLESRSSESTRLLFCTTGVLLRRLVDNPALAGVTHVIVDEVHERSLDSDFLLILLRDLLPRRPDLRVVLMSATINADSFAAYFGASAPCLTIPGFTHPVREHFLEEVVEMLKYKPSPGADVLRAQFRARPDSPEERELAAYQALARQQRCSAATVDVLCRLDQAKLNVELVTRLVEDIVTKRGPGAVLVFTSGLAEIQSIHEALRASRAVAAATGEGRWLIGLHSSLTTAQQAAVFERPPEGVRKVVVATNIAETSITIDDVVYVIDSGRAKENRYNPETHMQSLVEGWVSRAGARQRRGRAGRVQPGECFRLFTRWTHDNVFEEFQQPEILRVPLEGLCLQVKLLHLSGGAEGFLGRALDPPSREALAAAMRSLRDIGALDHEDNLTALGQHLALLPLDARLGKMLIYACIFSCLGPILTIAAAMSWRSPFVSPLESRDEADAVKRSFVPKGEYSDHLGIAAVYDAWVDARLRGRSEERAFTKDSFVSGKTLEAIADLRDQFQTLLAEAGFLAKVSRRAGRAGVYAQGVQEEANRHSGNLAVVRAVLVAGLYPNVCHIETPAEEGGKQPGSKKAAKAGRGARDRKQPPKLVVRGQDGWPQPVQLHPCSVNFPVTSFPGRWMVYCDKVQTSAVFLRDATLVSPYALLLFGGDLSVQHGTGIVRVDRWIEFRCDPRQAVLFRALRGQLDALLLRKVRDARADMWEEGREMIATVVALLGSEGR